MSALAITPAGIFTGVALVVVLIAVVGSALVWWTRRRAMARRTAHDDGPIIDLTYLEQAIRADEDATARRAAADRPLLSESPSAQPQRAHRLPRTKG